MKSALSLALIAIVAAIAGALLYQWNDSRQHEYAAKTLPAFELNDVDGKLRHSSEWQGKTLLINFWATWCPPCRKEIPLLINAQNKHASHNLQVIGIALEQAESVKAYGDEIGINYPSLVGSQAVIELGNKLGNRLGALPFSVLVGSDGRIIERHLGELNAEQLKAWLQHAN